MMRIARLTACALVASTAAACDAPPPRTLVQAHCVSVERAQPVTLTIVSPAAGTLRVGVEPRGVAIVARVQASSSAASSAVDRLGLVTLVEPVRAAERVVLRVESRDWPDIRGEVCIGAELVARSAVGRARAERAFARAGQATYRREWSQAFDAYAQAAQAYADLGLAPLAAAAYHAMGELAYSRLRRESDAPVFAGRALDALPTTAPIARGALLALKARAALETEDLGKPPAAREVRGLIADARSRFAATPYGARETARLGLVEGFLAYRTGAPKDARGHFERVRRECEALHDWECHAGAAQNIALLAEEEQSYQVALDAYAAAVRRLDTRIAPELAADLWDNYGRLQRVVGLVMPSKQSHDNALHLYAHLRNCDGVRRTLARIGALHAQVGSLEDAYVELERAASLDCERMFANLDPPRQQRSAESARRPTAACGALIDPAALSADGKLAVLQAVLALRTTMLLSGDLESAARCGTLAHRYAGTARGRLRASNAGGETLIEQGRAQDARQTFEAAQKAADAAEIPASNENRSRTLLGLARASLLSGDAKEARLRGIQALRASSARADVEQTVDALRALAASERALGETGLAARTLRVAAQLVEQVPIDELSADVRATYLSAQHAVFADLTELTASAAKTQAQAAEAFGLAERGRARSFKYALSQTAENPDAGLSDHAVAPYRAFLVRVTAAAERPDSDAAQLIANLDAAAAHGNGRSEAPDVSAVQARLRELNAVLVQYAAGPQEMFAFLIDPHGIRVVPLGAREAIADAAGELADRLRSRESTPASVREAARTVARQAWWPITAQIAGQRVLIAPDDALHLVPFTALPWAEASEELTVQRAETTVVPSGSFLAQRTANRRSPLRSFALLGDPVFRTAAWLQRCAASTAIAEPAARSTAWTEWLPSLPASRDEVLGIAALARAARPGSRVDTLIGCEATAQALTRAAAARSGVLHIATHGRIDARRPRLSALALSPDADSPDDASFGLLDILDLELTARLVTLSACETSQGRLLDGEGVLGPAQAFLEAGASTVVATFWKVEDETTARFMQAFYRRLLGRNMSAAAALRSTQLEEQTRSASYAWAAFGIYGRPDAQI